MEIAVYPAIFFTVALLVTNTYFLLGGLPLLTLEHDVPMDAKFTHRFLTVYYRAAFCTAVGASASYALWGRFSFALGGACIACISVLLARHLIGAMQKIGESIRTNGPAAIVKFRKLHAAALFINCAQLVVVVWGFLQLSKELS